MENGLSEKENEIQELKEELRLQREQNTKNLQDMEQQFTRQIQEMEKKHSSTTRRWVLMVLMISVLAGGTINAFTSTSEFSDVLQVVNDTLNSLAVKVSHNQHLNEELKDSTMALFTDVNKIRHDQDLAENGLSETTSSLSSEIEKFRHDQPLTEKRLNDTISRLSSEFEKVDHGQKGLRESMNRLSSEIERINQSQHLIKEGVNESYARSNSKVQGLSNNITEILNTIHQLKAKADAATVVSDIVRQDIEQLLSIKAKLNNIEKQTASSSDEKRKLVQTEKEVLAGSIDGLRRQLELTQEFFFFIDELSVCSCEEGKLPKKHDGFGWLGIQPINA